MSSLPLPAADGKRDRSNATRAPARSGSRPGHLLTFRRALPACINAALHVGIIVHLFARMRAVLTNRGTRAASFGVEVRPPIHKVRRRRADLRAIDEVSNVRRIGVLSALVQTVLECVQADSVTVSARFDAFHHFIVRHGSLLWRLSGVLSGRGATDVPARCAICVLACRESTRSPRRRGAASGTTSSNEVTHGRTFTPRGATQSPSRKFCTIPLEPNGFRNRRGRTRPAGAAAPRPGTSRRDFR